MTAKKNAEYNAVETSELESIKKLTPTSFEEAKNQINEFALRSDNNFGIPKVPDTGGLFGLLNHKVTGDELNNVIVKIQEYFISNNDVNIKTIKEFGKVYEALESLDSEYIPAILCSVKAAEMASKQANSATEHLSVAQEDLKKTLEELKKIVKILQEHKAKLDKMSHVENIDEIWSKVNQMEEDFTEISRTVDNMRTSRSVKLAYILGGSAFGAAVFQFILVNMGIL